jgi:chaperonin GroEL
MSQTKITLVEKQPFDIVKSAIDRAVNFIKPTYGPAANKVIISKVTHKVIADDGVQIARDLELPDEIEEAVWLRAKEVAIKTNDLVGDGTTSSLIMLQAIISEVAKRSRWEGHKIEAELKKGLAEVKEQLLAMAKPVKTLEDLKKVARVSFSDEKIADLIAELWFKIGQDGVVTIEGSLGAETTTELEEGILTKRGYLSPYMVTHPDRMEAIIEKPYILLTDYRLTEVKDVLPIMETMSKAQIFNLVIIAENIEQGALGTLIINKVQGKFISVAINIPQSNSPHTMMEDLALLTGGKVFSSDKGDKVENATIADLGRAEKFIARKDSSIILKPKGKKKDVEEAIHHLRAAIDLAEDPKEKELLRGRLAFFTHKVAIVKVGAATQNEQNSLKLKVEDAVNAVKSAYRGGVVCGAGLSLARVETSSPILNEALQYPFRQLMNNMGLDHEAKEFGSSNALNVKTGKTGPFLQVGVIDPVNVLIAGVESAVSIASLLVTASGMIVESVKKPPIQDQ